MYLVLNNGFQIASPIQSGFYKHKGMTDNNSITFTSKELAEEFAEYLAAKNQTFRFYVAEVTGYVQTDSPPLKWKRKEDAQ